MEPDVIAWPGPRHAGSAAATRPSADEVLAGLFSQHYVTLVRLTTVLLRNRTAAEAVVQDAFVDTHQQRLRDPDQALACLRRAVVNGSRSALRRPEPTATSGLRASAVAAALDALPRRQCEAVILRYYADLSETEAAAAMGVSEGSVNRHAHRGLATLQHRLHR